MSYGFLAGKVMPKIAASPLAHESHTIMQAQSILTKGGKRGPVLPYEQARRVVDHRALPDLSPEELEGWEQGLSARSP